MNDDADARPTPEAPPETQAPRDDDARPYPSSDAPPTDERDAASSPANPANPSDPSEPVEPSEPSEPSESVEPSADQAVSDPVSDPSSTATDRQADATGEAAAAAPAAAESAVPPASSVASPRPVPKPAAPRPRPPRVTPVPSGARAPKTPRTASTTPTPAAAGSSADASTTSTDTPAGPPAASFGRVAEDGTVFLRTADGERSVGQVPDATPDEALDFFVKRYDALALEVSLLERRVRSAGLSPEEAGSSVKTVRATVADAHAVGDLDGLLARLDALTPLIDTQRARRKAERAQQSEATRQAKEEFVAEAERLAQGNDWRGGVNRFRALLDRWKTLPRLDRATDDALWHRFSSARTQYTRRRKAQFAQQAEQRELARETKQKIIVEAEKLVGSTDWGPTTGEFRDLMSRWKAAGPAPRDVDEELWRKFRGIQDTFFAAKQAAMSEQDSEFRANQQAKEALLVEGEKLVPVTDLEAARTGYRDLVERWAAIGKVPRDAMRPLESRLQTIESAVRGAEEERWRRTNPEARARAEETAAKLQAQIAAYEERATKAAARGDAKAEQAAKDSAATYREWLTQAERAVDDFSG